MGQYRSVGTDGLKARFILLQLNLNLTDLLILLYAIGKICWLATYQWLGGNFLCKLYQFYSTLSFYISSNIILMIALDRLRTTLSPTTAASRRNDLVCHTLIVLSWVCAITCSIPQFLIWETVNVAAAFQVVNVSWWQCSDYWRIGRFYGTILPGQTRLDVIYDVFHLLFAFWIPFTLVLICYVIIGARLCQYSFRSATTTQESVPLIGRTR